VCGITGHFSFEKSFNARKFIAANNIIKYRGPDDYGYITINTNFEITEWKEEQLENYSGNDTIGAFGFRRLSIIDLSKLGHQPMKDSTSNYWIIFNGEIYNYIEIRDELKRKGYCFKSNSDTEVILNAYDYWGSECLHKFNGMWAFCIFDKKNKKIFCARDRFGIKPFYYTFQNKSFSFASEIKQLLELFPSTFNRMNKRLAFDFLAFGSYGNETSETYFGGIIKLNAGCYLEIDLQNNISKVKEKVWWNLSNINNINSLNNIEIFEKIAFLLEDSIKLRLRSDVPVGTPLSGGLDSSGIVSLLNNIYNGDAAKNKVFTITSNDKTNDDTYYANLIIDKIPVTSYINKFENNANLEELKKLIWHQEEPIQTASIFGSWQLYDFLKNKGITVALDGQGADELMGGYNTYPFRKYLLDTLKTKGITYYLGQVMKISNVYNKSVSEIIRNTFISFVIESSKSFNPQYFYSMKIKDLKLFFNTDFLNHQLHKSKIISKNYNSNSVKNSSILKQESYDLTRHTNLPGILRQVDRNSMAFSVESRLPFLDYRLVDFLYSLPADYMIKNGFTKYAYRNSMKRVIPKEVLWRKSKIGFKMPEFDLLNKNKIFVMDHLLSNSNENYLNKSIIEKEFKLMISDKVMYNSIVWRALCFSIWKKKFNLE